MSSTNTWIHKCDVCGKIVESPEPTLPPTWSELNHRAQEEFVNDPFMYECDLCDDCTKRALDHKYIPEWILLAYPELRPKPTN